MSDAHQINADALKWASRQMSGEMSTAERLLFEEWISSDPRRREAYRKIAGLETLMDAVATEVFVEDSVKDLEALSAQHAQDIQRAQKRRISVDFFAPLQKQLRKFEAAFESLCWNASNRLESAASLNLKGAALAASILAACLWAGIVVFTPPAATLEQFATAVGETQTVSLQDNTTVVINTASEVTVSYARAHRRIDLRSGEAAFHVMPDVRRPFIVTAGAAEVRVTGTRFSVRKTDADDAIVFVAEGSVLVSPGYGAPLSLGPSQSVRVHATGDADKVITADPENRLAWLNGKARFRETALADALSELNRYFVIPIVLEEKALEALPVTGEFDLTAQTETVNALSAAFQLEAEKYPDRIVLRRN